MEGLPDRFGKYHVLGLIARGGMAEIYKVKTVGIAGFEKIQALKRILPAYASRPRFIRSFVDEARIAVELNHRNIVQVFDFGKAEGELYLAMELIDGVDLRTAIRDAGRKRLSLPIALSCYILGEVGAGLDYAHRKKDVQGRALDIVHCDISPQNIALSREGFVKVLDFGVARAHIGTVSTSRRLRGKPRYMAPEQTRGDKPTAATDVFALGIIAWELLTGMPLFDGADLASVLAAVRRADAPPPAQLNPDVPHDLSAAVARALSPAPSDRGTAAQLSLALHEAARRLQTGIGSRALSEWLDTIYPPPPVVEDETTGVTAVEVPVAPPAEPTRPTTANPTATATLAGSMFEELDEDTPAPAALTEKRRVVALALALAGGDPAARAELAGMLADLAYKRGAVPHEQDRDDLVVVFGLEVAGEDNVARAMGFALDAVELAREGARAADGLALRIAARAGVVAQRRADGFHLVGDGVNEARALARDAEPGRPLLSGGAGRVTTAYYAFRDLPARRHHRRRLRVLELVGPRSFDERDRALRERRGRFVGRADELEQLGEAMAMAVRDGCRVTAAITGRAGVGKSRLVAEFVARASAREGEKPFLVAVAATPAATLAPFSLVTELFQTSLNLPPGRGESARGSLTQRLRHVFDRAEVPREEIDEAVAALELAMEIRDGATVSRPAAPADLRERVAAALRSFRQVMVAGDRPLLTVLEDIHLADAASAEILRSVLRPPPAPAAELVIITMRDGTPPPVSASTHVVHLHLDELADDERRDLIRDRLAEAATGDAVEAVARRAGGNPLFVEELAAAVREIGPDEVPASARDVVVARVDRLPAAAKGALQHAAVIGHTFRQRILEELLGASLHEELTVLFDEGFLTRADRAALDADEGELQFAQGLFHEVVYQSLSASSRRETHAAVGRLLASRYQAGREEPPASIAYHLERGGKRAAASAYWLRAGRLSLAAFDARAAVNCFTRTLEIEALEADDGTVSKVRRREALLGRERAHATLGDHASPGPRPRRPGRRRRRRAAHPGRRHVPPRRAALAPGRLCRRRGRHRRSRAGRRRRRRRAPARRGAAPARRGLRAPGRLRSRRRRAGPRAGDLPPHRRQPGRDPGDDRRRSHPPDPRPVRGRARGLRADPRAPRGDRRPVARTDRPQPPGRHPPVPG